MIGPTEMILIFGVIVLLFGASKLPELARSMGKATGEFKRAQRETELEMRRLDKPIRHEAGSISQNMQKLATDLDIKTEMKGS